MNRRRLLKLADMLEADAANRKGLKFDLDIIGEVELGAKPGLNCETSGCAIGLACLSGAFKRAGLGYEVRVHVIEPTWEGKTLGWLGYLTAAENLFGIDSHQAAYLFDSGHYDGDQRGAKGERVVARRIRRFVANNGVI